MKTALNLPPASHQLFNTCILFLLICLSNYPNFFQFLSSAFSQALYCFLIAVILQYLLALNHSSPEEEAHEFIQRHYAGFSDESRG